MIGGMQTASKISDDQRRRRFQFRICELFICVTVAAVFAMVGRWGVNGMLERLEAGIFVGSLLATVMEIHYRIKANLGQ